MNTLKTILAGSIAMTVASTALADVTVRLTGSTAYRGATHLAIAKILGGSPAAGYKGSSLSGASQAWFRGTISGHPELGTVTIKTSWSGSVGGVQTVSQNVDVSFLPDTLATTPGNATASGTSLTGGTVVSDALVAEKPLVAMSDTFQNSTPFTSPSLTDTVVGVVPFKWVVSNPGSGNPAPFTNITPQQAQALWGAGSMSLALFTGLNGDEGVSVFATGRDPDSGTRLTAFAESGIGVAAVVAQYKPSISGGAVTGYAPYPQQVVNGITFPQGQGGEASGGTLAGLMGGTTNRTVGYSVTYLSTGDAATAITAGAKEISYNGVPYSLTAVQEGLYTFWGYEHLMYRTSALSANAKTVADTLANQIITTDATVLLGSMKVSRPTDGGLVTQNY